MTHAKTLLHIRTKLDRLRLTDGGFKVFGAKVHLYREAPALQETQLQLVEVALGVLLPDELRSFLKYVHGGGPGPGYGLHLALASACPKLARRHQARAVDPIRAVLSREGRGRGRISLVPMLGEQEVEITLPGFYSVTPRLRQALKALPGVERVDET